ISRFIMRLSVLCLAFACTLTPPLAAWGARGHQLAAAAACQDLPPEVAPWFQGLEAVVVAHCADPDQWKHSDPLEGPRHYLDVEPYGTPDQVPHRIQDAMARL